MMGCLMDKSNIGINQYVGTPCPLAHPPFVPRKTSLNSQYSEYLKLPNLLLCKASPTHRPLASAKDTQCIPC